MAKFKEQPKVEVTTQLTINEAELRALDALVGYGVDPFLKAFYEQLGKTYMQPHEAGLRELFETIRTNVPGILHRIDSDRKAFNNN
ncbi:hypothetical protein D3C76_28270 [compost metagenome]